MAQVYGLPWVPALEVIEYYLLYSISLCKDLAHVSKMI